MRWLVRMFLILVVLAALAVLAVQIIFMTDLPRRTIVDALERETGLRIATDRVDTGWAGGTTLHNVTATLPLSDEPFIVAPSVRVSHARLLRLLAGGTPENIGALGLESIELERPRIIIRQEADGQWNVMRALEIVAPSDPDPAAPARGGPTPLPRVSVVDAIVEVRPLDRDPVTFDPVWFEGKPDGRLQWDFQARVVDALAVDGQLVPVGDWLHRVEISAPRLDRVIRPWLDVTVPEPVAFEGRWQGQFIDRGLTGALHVERFEMPQGHAAGTFAIATAPSPSVRIDAMRVEAAQLPAPLEVRGGTAKFVDNVLAVSNLELSLLGNRVDASGRWDTAGNRGDIDMTWSGETIGPVGGHRGGVKARLALGPHGSVDLDGTLQTRGSLGDGAWNARMDARASGASWSSLDVELDAERMTWRDAQGEIDLSGLALTVAYDRPSLRLTRLNVPQARVRRATAAIDLSTQVWEVNVNVDRFEPPRMGMGEIALVVEAAGERGRARVSTLEFNAGRLVAVAKGVYDHDAAEAVRGEARLSYTLAPPKGEGPTLAPHGRLSAAVDVYGSVSPLAIDAAGKITSDDLAIGEKPLGPVEIPLQALIQRERSALMIEPFPLLGGTWRGEVGYSVAERTAQVRASVKGLTVDRLTDLVGLPLKWTGDVNASVAAVVSSLDLEDVELTGEWDVREFRGAVVRADVGRGRFWTRGGAVRIDPMRLEQRTGSIEGSIAFNVRDRQRLLIDVTAKQWPIEVEAQRLLLVFDGGAKLDANIVEMSARGEATLSVDAAREGVNVGTMEIASHIQGRTVEVTRLDGRLFEGKLSGQLVVPLDELVESTGQLEWERLNLLLAAESGVPTGGLVGFTSGSATIERSNDPRALEPLRILVNADNTAARFREASLGNVMMIGFLGRERFVLDDSRIEIAGGVLNLWAQVTRRPQGNFAQARVTLQNLDLNQLVRTINPEADPMPGRISGNVRGVGRLARPHNISGLATIQLADSDLVGSDIVASLYSALRVDTGERQPTGYGTVSARLEGEAMELTHFEYFNRGTQILIAGTVENIALGMESPVDIYATGASQLFRDLPLPFLANVDQLLNALQGAAAAVHAEGTLGEPNPRIIPLPQISGQLERLLRGTIGTGE